MEIERERERDRERERERENFEWREQQVQRYGSIKGPICGQGLMLRILADIY